MAIQDLTPQLRTRLNRMERAVGWFVFFATALLVLGFAYYIYTLGKNKGWFQTKIYYQTGVNNAAGLKAKDKVKLMGLDAGEIVDVEPNDPSAYYGLTVTFYVKEPHYGYVWSDSSVKILENFLGNRYLEVTKGQIGLPTVLEGTNKTIKGVLKHKFAKEQFNALKKGLDDKAKEQNTNGPSDALIWWELKAKSQTEDGLTNYYDVSLKRSPMWITPAEAPALNDRLEKLANQVEQALPNILGLTNTINAVLNNTMNLTSNLNTIAVGAQPVVSNLTVVTAQLNGPGTLGDWLLSSNMQYSLEGSLETTRTNLPVLMEDVGKSLENLANITSNLNVQVQSNSNMLQSISTAVTDADDLVQGLKRHWLLKSAFKTKATNAPPVKKK